MNHGPINPATGLPMISDDVTGFDIAGNPFGFDLHTFDTFSSNSSFDDTSCFDTLSTFDSGFGSGNPWD